MARAIWIARHANREDFVDPNWSESAARPHDPGLSPDGVEQARRLGQRLAATGLSHIFASPFLRGVQTANHVASYVEQPVFLEPGLGEWLNADWFSANPEIKPAETLAQEFEYVDLRHTPCLHPDFPEEREEAFKRIGRAAQCLTERYAEADELLLVGHGVTVIGVLRGFVDDVEEAGCPLCSLTRLVRDGDTWSVVFRNDTTHLDRTAAADRFN